MCTEMSRPTSETYVSVADKLRGRYRGVDQRPRCSDQVDPDSRQRHKRAADGDEEGGGAAGSAGVRGRRRRQRAAGGQRKSRQQQQQQPEAITSPLRLVDVADDYDDDAGSVCSGASSASENSTASRGSSGAGRPGRRPRGPSRSSNSRRCGSRDTTRQTEQSFAVGKCHTRSTGASPPTDSGTMSGSCCGVERPEPEGGVRTAPYKSVMSDEFDRLIYGPCEPLFSDVEDSLTETLDDDVDVAKDCRTTVTTSGAVRPSQQQRRRRFTGAVSNVDETTDSLFSAAQMINSNNMMKFAIIQMELKNVKDISLRRVGRSSAATATVIGCRNISDALKKLIHTHAQGLFANCRSIQ